MWINLIPDVNTDGVLNQIEKVEKLAEELENETYKLREMIRKAALNEKKGERS